MLKSSIAFWFVSLGALSLSYADGEKLTETYQGLISYNEQDKGSEDISNEVNCGKTLHHMRAGVRYTSKKGIGYKEGYTTLEGFFAPNNEVWLPFLDLRGHVFDNGTFAANAGLGLRYIGESHIWGVNAYYDYRNTSRQQYNQVAAGLETLGRVWDFRINGYLPVGQTHTHFSHFKFASFKGHNLYLSRARDYAMGGFNAEAGVHVDHFKKAPLYLAAGPYYLTGIGETTWGGKIRAAIDLFHRNLRLEGNTAYDHFFKWTGQGQISFNISFGGRKQVTRTSCDCCSKAMMLQTRAIQRVDRSEIIPVVRQHVSERAINPATSQPWVFWFVDNTSSSAGTFESPFPTLVMAQDASSTNEAIYVFPGDGTSQGMNAGIALKNSQYFLGASISHPIPTTKGIFIVPPMASKLPSITNLAGDVVTLASDNIVSGFFITSNNGNGLTGNGISNLFADQNTFVTALADTNGINLINPQGEVSIRNSSFDGFNNNGSLNNGDGIYVEIGPDTTLNNLMVADSHFSNFSNPGMMLGGVGIFVQTVGGTINNMNITDCSFNNFSNNATGIEAFRSSGIFINSNVSGCTFNSFDTSLGIEIVNLSDSNISNCTFSQISGGTGITLAASVTNSNVSACTFTNISSGRGIVLHNDDSTMVNSNISDCTFGAIGNSIGISIEDITNSTITNLNLMNCTFGNINGASKGISISSDGTSTITRVNTSDNNFAGGSGIAAGYAVDMAIAGGTTCLNFTNNSASPATVPIPYQFNGTGATFNRTAGSDASTNTGTIQTTNVNAPGTCTQ